MVPLANCLDGLSLRFALKDPRSEAKRGGQTEGPPIADRRIQCSLLLIERRDDKDRIDIWRADRQDALEECRKIDRVLGSEKNAFQCPCQRAMTSSKRPKGKAVSRC